jgi:hypothetical protein
MSVVIDGKTLTFAPELEVTLRDDRHMLARRRNPT